MIRKNNLRNEKQLLPTMISMKGNFFGGQSLLDECPSYYFFEKRLQCKWGVMF